jgi:hypothetical protein
LVDSGNAELRIDALSSIRVYTDVFGNMDIEALR